MFAFVHKLEYNINIAQHVLLSISQLFEQMLLDVINGILNVTTRFCVEGWNVYRRRL